MKLAILSLSLLAITPILVSCASTPEELEYKMIEKEKRFDDRQEMYAIRSEGFDRRLQKMSDNADNRMGASFDQLMAE
tara:strand:- start:3545 stop:3778 length:234 start_codon:yes stop_codon:yes gene_type:complete